MTDLYQLLAADALGKDYYSEDPFYSAGRGILGIQSLPPARNNTEAFGIPFLQGLLGGTLAGYGKSRASDAAFEDARESAYISPFIQKFTPEVVSSLDPAQLEVLKSNPLYKYLSEERPDDYTPNTAKIDTVRGILQQQNLEQYLLKKQEQQQEVANALLKEGKILTEEGTIQTLPGFAESEGDITKSTKKAELEAEADLYGYNPKIEEETDKLRKEFSQLPEVKNFAAVEKAGKIINEAIKDPSAVSDQELVRYSILLIEPGMAVREGEQAAVAASQSIPEEWRGSLSKALKGGTALGPEIREGLKRLADRAYQGNREQYDRTYDFYREQAKLKRLDPDRISYMGEAAPGLETRIVEGRTYYRVNGGWRAK